MATANSAVSFQGLSSGIQTDALISAILAQEGTRVAAMKARQDQNTQRLSSLSAMRSSMTTAVTSLATLRDKMNARTVTSSDSSGTYVSANAVGAEAGSYDLQVHAVATKGRLAPTMVYSGTSSAPGLLGFVSSTAKTTTGTVSFTIGAASVPGGAVSGTFTVGGTTYALTGTDGTLSGAAGTPLEGLKLSVNGTGGGSGTLSLSAEPSNLSASDPAAAIFSGGATQGTFAIQGTDGVIKTVTVTDNSLNGLKNAINGSGAGVVATIVNTGQGSKPYQLVITAKDSGTGTTSGVVTLADITSGGPVNTLGISGGTVDNQTAPTTLTGGLTSTQSGASGQAARFSLNGIELTRQSNTISDVVSGVTFTLKQGGQTGTTTLTVAQDKSTATLAVQDFISKYNALVTAYKGASTSTKNADGSINQAPLSGDSLAASMIRQLRAALAGPSAGLSATSAFQNLASIGFKTQTDGTLSLDSYQFQTALDKDPGAVRRLFLFSGESNNSAVTVTGGTSDTATGPVAFTISSIAADGTITGTLNGAAVTGSNGVIRGSGSLSGLTLSVTGIGSGTLNLSRGALQAFSDLFTSFTNSATGAFATDQKNIQAQNDRLAAQIEQGQALLDRRKVTLQKQFADMEVAVAKMRASAGSLSGA